MFVYFYINCGVQSKCDVSFSRKHCVCGIAVWTLTIMTVGIWCLLGHQSQPPPLGNGSLLSCFHFKALSVPFLVDASTARIQIS